MSQRPHQPAEAANRYPLSDPQQLWHSGDLGEEAGFFSSRFIMVSAWRITGRVDVAALQQGLNDVVQRHEILRTVVVRDADPPYQQVHPAQPVDLSLRDLSTATGTSRDASVEQLLTEAAQSTLSPRAVPLLRATLGTFDDLDSVLTLITHHTVCDEWSFQVIMRDLAACYAARIAGQQPELPKAQQYRDFTAWQQAGAAGPATAAARTYWRQRMQGARIFAVPTDRIVPQVRSRPCSARNFVLDADVMARLARFAESSRASIPMALLAAFNVLAHEISGMTDLAIDTLTTGRNDPRFHDSVGPLMNFLVYRTDLAGCVSFRDVVSRTRDSCLQAAAHEVPIQHIEREVPELMAPNEDPQKTNCIVGIFQPPFDAAASQIADGCHEICTRSPLTPVDVWIPHGVAWSLHLPPSGELCAHVQFNLEELDESSVAGWVSSYQRILCGAASDPDREWRAL
jgi:hypothetical protein